MSRTLPDKLYFRIGEVAEIVGVEPHVLRYWETEFRTIRPEKSRKGQRVYSRRDVETLMKVKELLYGHRYTIAGAKRQLSGGTARAGSHEEGEERAAQPSGSPLGDVRTRLIGLRADIVRALATFQE